MHSYASRFASFRTVKTAANRRKSNVPRDFVPWPHPTDGTYIATPETLAEAGFYHDPSPFDPDNVCCFLCGKELGEWEPEDDPFLIHAEKCPKCPWVVLNFALAMDMKGQNEQPNTLPPLSNILYKARLATYGTGRTKWWPHDKTKGHGALSKNMALAGFIYSPDPEGGVDDDTAACLYCDLELSGWEPSDDPFVEHTKHARENSKQCAFLDAVRREEDGSMPEKFEEENKGKKPTRGKTTKKTTRAPLKKLDLQPIAENDIELLLDDVAKLNIKATGPVRSPVKKQPARARKSIALLPQVDALKKVGPATKLRVRTKPATAAKDKPKKLEAPPSVEDEVAELFPPDLVLTIRERYELCGRLGSGSFGTVYRAKDHKRGMRLVAVKLEAQNAPYKSIAFEADVYRRMNIKTRTGWVPPMLWCGDVPGNGGTLKTPMYKALVLPLLGPSLQTVWKNANMALGFCTVMRLAQQMIAAIEWLHDQRIIHRDIKPDNFVVGFGEQASKIFLIDFGLAKCYARNDGTCIPYRSGKSFVGNFRFAGIGTQSGIEPARRDDLEAVGYVLAYLYQGDLPWRRFETVLDPDRILWEKQCTPPLKLCPSIPTIGALIDYARMLDYEARPAYGWWVTAFKQMQLMHFCPTHPDGPCKFEWEES